MNSPKKLLDAIAVSFHQSLLVEGKNDAAALRALGFSHVFILNEHRGSLRERVERICGMLSSVQEKEICLLFDNDAEGRKLIAQCGPIVRELGIRLKQGLRREFIKAGVSHVEGIETFIKKREG